MRLRKLNCWRKPQAVWGELSDHDRRIIREFVGGRRDIPDAVRIEPGPGSVQPSSRLSPEELEEKISRHTERVEREEPAHSKANTRTGGKDKAARAVHAALVEIVRRIGPATTDEVTAEADRAGLGLSRAEVNRRLKYLATGTPKEGGHRQIKVTYRRPGQTVCTARHGGPKVSVWEAIG